MEAPEPPIGAVVGGGEEILAVGKAVAEIGLAGARRRRGAVGPGEVGREDWPGFEKTVVVTVEKVVRVGIGESLGRGKRRLFGVGSEVEGESEEI